MSNLEIKPYLMRCVYHIEEREDYRILASSKEQAGAIGRIKFKEGQASIMASATPFCFCTTQKHLAVKRSRSSMA